MLCYKSTLVNIGVKTEYLYMNLFTSSLQPKFHQQEAEDMGKTLSKTPPAENIAQLTA